MSRSKILVVGPSWLGDMIMTQALLKELKNKYNKSNREVIIDVLAPRWCSAVLDLMPEVHKAITMPFDHGEVKLYQRYKFAKLLRSEHYNECIVVPNSFKSALIPYWAGIPKRTGWLGEFRYLVLNNHQKLNKQYLPLMVQRLLALAHFDPVDPVDHVNFSNSLNIQANYPSLRVTNDLKQDIVSKNQIDINNNILILAPGAAFGGTKKWPEEYFAEIAIDRINNNSQPKAWQVIILGSPNDKQTTDNIENIILNNIDKDNKNRVYNFAGKIKLNESIALVSMASIIISNDSGLLHVAAALNIPLIGIYGSTSPGFTPPLIEDHKKSILTVDHLDCRPCFKRVCKFEGNNAERYLKCLKDITPAKVKQAMSQLLNETA